MPPSSSLSTRLHACSILERLWWSACLHVCMVDFSRSRYVQYVCTYAVTLRRLSTHAHAAAFDASAEACVPCSPHPPNRAKSIALVAPPFPFASLNPFPKKSRVKKKKGAAAERSQGTPVASRP